MLAGSFSLAKRHAFIVGFLDQLKQKTEALQVRAEVDSAEVERREQATEAACQRVLRYWLELAKQLNVLRPVNKYRFALDRRHVLDGLVQQDFHVDARKQSLHGRERCQQVVMHWQMPSGQKLVLTRDLPPAADQLLARLRQGGIDVHPEMVRHPETGRFEHTKFAFTATLVGTVRLQPLHDDGQVAFELLNIDDIARVRVTLPADQVDEPLLDELAQLIAGHPSKFYSLGRTERSDIPL